MRRLANAAELRAELSGSDKRKTKIMLQGLFRALQNETHCIQELKEYPESGLKGVTREEFRAKGPFFLYVSNEISRGCIRIADRWLGEAIQRDESWLKDVDANGRIKRLLGLKRVDQVLALAEADLARYERIDRIAAACVEERAQVAEVLALPEGRTWVQLMTQAAFTREGFDMGHCIGDAPYFRNHVHGYAQYFSLRDRRGRPRVTLEARQGMLMQVRGTANGDPWPKWRHEIEALIAHMGWRLCPQPEAGGFARRRALPLAFSTVNGDLDLTGGPQPAPLATRLQVCGNLIARSRDWLTSLPDTLWVEGDCLVECCRNLVGAPRVLMVHGRASFAGTVGMRSAFERIVVWGNLDLSRCVSLTALPDKVHVGGRLDITGSGLSGLPATLSVGDRIVCGRFDAKSVAEMNAFLVEAKRTPRSTQH